MVKKSREALRRFVPILHREAGAIVSLIGVDDPLRTVIADWFRTLRTRTDFLSTISADDGAQPPPGFGFWDTRPLDEALSKAIFTEARAVQVLETISKISTEIDALVGALKADGQASGLLRYLVYIVSDVVDVQRAIVRKFPSLDSLDKDPTES